MPARSGVHFEEAVLQGLESIERGNFIELHTHIVERGKSASRRLKN